VAAESEDARLIARCRAGDRQAQEALVQRYQQCVYRLACNLLDNPEDALDACQDALVAILRSLPRFRGESSLQTWVYRVAVNTCIMKRRSLRARTRLIVDLPAHAAESAQQTPDPGFAALRREIQAAVREHLRRLPPEFRAVVVLRELDGMSYQQIAETLQMPLGTVQSRLNRGRRLLRDYFLADERIRALRPGGEGP
jgi:RNA polymerase sigma-70 factor (ECF subfamily)